MSKSASDTPMMRQFYDAKRQHPDKILFFRMGDFYEMFGEDAVVASPILQIALTSRNKSQADAIPMCGVPYRAYESYLNKLTAAGHKVAICEQTEDPAQAKGLVQREIVRIVTPGTTVSQQLLPPDENHYLLTLLWQTKPAGIGVALADVSTGELEVTEFSLEETSPLLDCLSQWKPREILLPEPRTAAEHTAHDQFRVSLRRLFPDDAEARTTQVPAYWFDESASRQRLQQHFGTLTLAGFGIEHVPRGIRAAGALLSYLEDTQKCSLNHIASIRQLVRDQTMQLDETTIRNLEIFENSTGQKRHTLYHVLNRTVTPMGARLLRQWLRQPLLDAQALQGRYDAVEELHQNTRLLRDLRQQLSPVQDLPRIAGRISLPVVGISDLVALRASLEPLQTLPALFQEFQTKELTAMAAQFDPLDDVRQELLNKLHAEPSLRMQEGGYIADGVSAELDELRNLSLRSKDFLNQLLTREREQTGIASLKISFNKVFGYYLEVSNAHKQAVPAHYIRKQTLVNCERYITQELKEFEEKILTAEERMVALEQELFQELQAGVLRQVARIQQTAACVARIDVFSGWAELARDANYVRPRLRDASQPRQLSLRKSRHPVIEQLDLGEPFVPNDVELDEAKRQVQLITGPNMAGKSTFMRQVALNVLMAQCGCFVAAEDVELTVVDRVFTRVGASDNLSLGQSTFMVEMNEAAAILNNATAQSLVILDEIGRGTSTFDGISIAWAIVEHIHQLGALTLCATHYHELTQLAQQLARVVNASVQVDEDGEHIVFLRKIVDGEADKSYGVHVARLAGMPPSVVARAMEVMHTLENSHELGHAVTELSHSNGTEPDNESVAEPPAAPTAETPESQLSLFPQDSWLAQELRALPLSHTTPMEALNFLHQLQQRLQ